MRNECESGFWQIIPTVAADCERDDIQVGEFSLDKKVETDFLLVCFLSRKKIKRGRARGQENGSQWQEQDDQLEAQVGT